MTRVSEPSVSVSDDVIERGMDVSSAPDAGATLRLGGVAVPVTETAKVDIDVADVPFSNAVAVTLRLITPLLCSGGVRVSPMSWAGVNVHVPLPLFNPADRTAPAGTPAIRMERTSDPSVSAREAEMFSAIAVSSVPLAGGVTKTGASATPSTVTERGWLRVDVELPSLVVAVIPRLITPLKFEGGKSVRPIS